MITNTVEKTYPYAARTFFKTDGLGSIELIETYGDDLAVVNAAKVSYGNQSTSMGEKEIKLLKFLADNNHTSPFRHCFLKFRIDMPMFVKFQWWKHIIGSNWGVGDDSNIAWNEISGRYTSKHITEESFYIPKEYRKQSEINKQASEDADNEFPHSDYEQSIKKHCEECLSLYNDLVKEGIAKEQARMVLPMNLRTQVIWTASLQAVAHFIKLRTDKNAQYEIQLFADEVKWMAETYFPHSMNALLNSNQKSSETA